MLFVDAFLQNNRLDHVTQVMGYHPTYLDVFLRTQNFILRGDGPLPYDYRHFIAIMVRPVWQKSVVVEWSGKAWLREEKCDTNSGVYWSWFISIWPYPYLTIQNRWGTVPWYQFQPCGMLKCIHSTCKTLQSITTTTTTWHCKVSTPPQDIANYQHHHKTLQSINTICETLQSVHATSETLQCIKTMHGTLHSIPITWNADMGTHVEELGKQSNKNWHLTVEHSTVHLAITPMQCVIRVWYQR